MRVRVYGNGTQKREWPIAGIKKALFLIGGIHRVEEAGITMIRLMEEHIKRNPFIIPDDTTVFVLNPVHETNNREINGIDPNRDFELRRLPETKAIVALTDFLVQQYGEIRIISGH
ncbi:MAG: hypothetical protein LBV17_00560, partial [Treponema sp.]|nr:hypothetical protein [Treponema sp.]